MRLSLSRLVVFFISILVSRVLFAELVDLQPRVQVNAPHVILGTDINQWLRENYQVDVGVWGPSHPPIGEGISDGKYQGIAADYLALLENALQIKFVLHVYRDSNEALAAMQRHEIQMLAMWNPERWPSNALKASAPWLLDKSVILSREDEAALPASFEKSKLGVVAETPNALPISEIYSASQLHYYRQFDEAISAVSYGQIDYLWLNRATANFLTHYQHITGLTTTPSSALPNLNISFGIDRQLPQLLTAIDTVLQQVPLESRMRIAVGWGLNREAVMTQNPLGLTVQEEHWLHSVKHIPVIIDSRHPPISFVQDGAPAGLIVDVLEALNERYGLEFNLIVVDEKKPLNSVLQAHPDALQVNQWRIPGLTTKTEDITLSSALLTSPMVVIMQQSIAKPRQFSNLKGERLAINRDNPLVGWLQTWFPSIELQLTDDLYQAQELLKTNAVRGIIAPQIVARYLVAAETHDRWQIAIAVPLASAQLVFSGDNAPSLPLDIINKALTNLPPESIIALSSPWQQPSTTLMKGVSDRTLWITMIWSSVVLIIVALSGLWIYRLYRTLKLGAQSQEALSDQLSFTRTLIDNTPIALYARDREGRLLDFNQQWRDTVNMPGKSLIGSAITDLTSVPQPALQQLAMQYKQALERGEPQRWSGPFLVHDRQHILDGWAVPWRDSRGEIGGLIGGWIDVTEKETLIAHLQQAKTELEQAHASKAAFMQSMGHEIRTPLNAIIGLLEFEFQSQQQQEHLSENLPLIWESAGNLLSLIGDVFDIFRADNIALRGVVRSVHLPQLIESTVALYRQQLDEKALTLEIENALNTPRFEADSLLIIRIFSSLLRNAIKHSQGNVISIAVYQGRQEADNPLVPLVIEVANAGEMPMDVLQQNEKKASALGWHETGMSLTDCQIMAGANGAELSIESDEEDGTTISLYFNAEPSAENRPVTSTKAARALTILIVDDYPPGRRALRQQLEGWGHVMFEAGDGEKALELWQQYHATIDLMITDCTMPIIDGFSLTRLMREEEEARGLAPLPIFGLTAMTGFETTTRCLAAGMNECLIKPLSPIALQTVLQRYFPELQPSSSITRNPVQPDPQLLREMVELNQQDGVQLRQALMAGDRIIVGRLAHRLRGASMLLNEEKFYTSCKVLELACEQSLEMNEIEQLVQDVLEDLEIINRNIRNVLEEGV